MLAILLARIGSAIASLHFTAIPCPVTMPREACFGVSAPATESFWRSNEVKLPLSETLAYVRNLLQKALEVEHASST